MTKTKSYTTLLAENDAALVSKAQETIEALLEARATLPDLEAAAEEAEDGPEDIEVRWSKGEDVPSIVYLTAQAEAVKAKAVYRGAKTRLASLERSTPNTDLRVAKAVAHFLSNVLVGVEVVPALGLLKEDPKATELPLAVVAQAKPGTENKEGMLSGEVEVIYFRSPLHKEVDPRKVEEAAAAAGMHAKVTARPSSDNRDKLRIMLEGGWTDAPRILNIQGDFVNRLGQRIAQNLASEIRYDSTSVAVLEDRAYESSHVIARPTKTEVASEDITDGIRTLTVKARVMAEQKVDHRKKVPSVLADMVEVDYKGLFVPGLGVVTGGEAKFIDSSTNKVNHRTASLYEVTMTFRSSV